MYQSLGGFAINGVNLTKLQSYPDILHGGISATILDETIGRAIMVKYGQNSFGLNAYR